MDRALLITRLNELKSQAEAGKKILAGLDAQRLEAQETLLRISGVIQVLEEVLAANPEQHPTSD